MPDAPRLRLRIHFAGDAMLGPGKADLLETIRATGSISAAARQMGMSYKRAWQLVEMLNSMFRVPLVVRTRGGTAGGGAVVTAEGLAVLADFRALEQVLLEQGAGALANLTARLADATDPK